MTQDEMKRLAALAALDYVEGGIIGVGTGSTVNHFIDCLATIKGRIDGAVSSSEVSTQRMKAHGIPVFDLNAVGDLELYVDGADESNHRLELIKGGGGALTREKIVAAAADHFVVIADDTKLVPRLGATFRLPIEVLTFGWRQSAAAVAALGLKNTRRARSDGRPVITDNGNFVLDADLPARTDLRGLELALNAIPGVLECGLFVGMAGEAFVGDAAGQVRRIRREKS